jgi:molybdenum cofactor cytidylyltransferase
MGANKLLVEVLGETLLRRAARALVAAGLDPVIAVLGHEAERARAELADLPCRTVLNPDHARGLGTSVRTGIAALPPTAVAAVVALADMPAVTPEMIAALVERHRLGDAPLVVSEYDGVVAPPVLYRRSLFQELAALEGESAGRAVIERHRAEAVAVAWPASALRDVDVPADLQRLRDEGEAR